MVPFYYNGFIAFSNTSFCQVAFTYLFDRINKQEVTILDHTI